MRNLIGGVVGAIIACLIIVIINNAPLYIYPEPFGQIWFILDGPRYFDFSITMLQNTAILVGLLISIGVAGITLSIFSQNAGNTIRTCLWMGITLGSLHVASILLVDSSFWTSAERNVTLLILFIQNILIALTSIVSAIPLVWLRKRLMDKNEEVLPPIIQTKCECGAIFKSNPLICSECGRKLKELSSLSTNTSTK